MCPCTMPAVSLYRKRASSGGNLNFEGRQSGLLGGIFPAMTSHRGRVLTTTATVLVAAAAHCSGALT